MRRRSIVSLIAAFVPSLILSNGYAADAPAYTRTEDVIYGRRPGLALTMDVFTPKTNANGAAVIYVVSGGWFSAHEFINAGWYTEYLKRGYTVFAVVHGSQPKCTIPEILEDMNRSVRFIRHNAERFHIDPSRIGITGGSAGGHLSLMIATAGKAGPADAKDPVDRESSRVQAVGCYFPPTDFMNYGETGRDVFKALTEELKPYKAPFDFSQVDAESKRYVLIEDMERRRQIAKDISPVTHVTSDDPPALILHGDADKLVWIQQAQVFQKKCEEMRVPMKLVVKPGAGHGWENWIKDMATIADWFDTHLAKPSTTTKPD